MPRSNDPSRRRFLSTLAGGLGAAGAFALAACGSPNRGGSTTAAVPQTADPSTPTPAGGATVAPLAANGDEALALLVAGNRRFAADHLERADDNVDRRLAVRTSQKPFATILSCVDSRVLVELIFDRGFGDLVVVRSAGEVLDKAVTGSLEFGVAELNTPLLMVLGHQRCGALTAAVGAYDKKKTDADDLGFLEDALSPAVQRIAGKPGDRITNAVLENVALVRDQLRQSPVIGPLESQGKVKLVGAYYNLDNGQVQLL
ncbi:carbonic anhydrase (plasmid) [Mycolicibacterium arabiense]|uniref:Carbonic anhydrase n=1 Tax=Mycolicibacterium arabiense TaxID=1286181 RepID=A0A7I7RQA3_9MYCO|nr:carbonic anhydrase [Mycolicibacterium arabiense]MCV7376947.1 carbonic anhydrase [Mycolicibacterium arabiense]BBY46758.1 carbonic anhydrase [Mycolicibacterium arabiense]